MVVLLELQSVLLGGMGACCWDAGLLVRLKVVKSMDYYWPSTGASTNNQQEGIYNLFQWSPKRICLPCSRNLKDLLDAHRLTIEQQVELYSVTVNIVSNMLTQLGSIQEVGLLTQIRVIEYGLDEHRNYKSKYWNQTVRK